MKMAHLLSFLTVHSVNVGGVAFYTAYSSLDLFQLLWHILSTFKGIFTHFEHPTLIIAHLVNANKIKICHGQCRGTTMKRQAQPVKSVALQI